MVADALSRDEGSDSEILPMALTIFECDLLKQIQDVYQKDDFLKSLIV